jgi:hypothetical protein
MQVEYLRKLLKKRPFQPVELLSDGGEKLLIRHPDAVLIGKELIVAMGPDDSVDYLEARNVSKVRIRKRRTGAH